MRALTLPLDGLILIRMRSNFLFFPSSMLLTKRKASPAPSRSPVVSCGVTTELNRRSSDISGRTITFTNMCGEDESFPSHCLPSVRSDRDGNDWIDNDRKREAKAKRLTDGGRADEGSKHFARNVFSQDKHRVQTISSFSLAHFSVISGIFHVARNIFFN
jgi:hypothetical protein